MPPIMVKSASNPGGLPIEVFDGFRAQLAANRAQFYLDVADARSTASTAPGAKISEGIIENWWRQGMMGGVKAHYDCIKAFSETDFTEDLKKIDVPVLVMHGDDDQIVPIADSALLSAKLLKRGTLKVYKGCPHGMCATHPEIINRGPARLRPRLMALAGAGRPSPRGQTCRPAALNPRSSPSPPWSRGIRRSRSAPTRVRCRTACSRRTGLSDRRRRR